MPTRPLIRTALLALAWTATVQAQENSVYTADRLVTIDIQLDAEDWHELRLQKRSTENFTESPYRYFEATVAIDGEQIERVGLRKKGFFGSVVSTKPSLKIRFDEYVEGRTFQGLDQLTLNNNVQDSTQLHQYLAYRIFRKAGVAAPRAGLALVTVNGEKLGIYSNVESIRRPFIRRVFGTDSGRLYEGYAADFDEIDGEIGKIVNKWAKKPDAKRGPVERLGALLTDEPFDLAKLRELVDLDAFITYWAVEVLVGHWDGYSGNRNNYYLYRHGETKRLYFIPWGADDVFRDPGPFIRQPVPKSVKCIGVLTQRLWSHPESRQLYQAEMRRLLKDVWVEQEIRDEIDRIGELFVDHLDERAWKQATEEIHDFLDDRREEIEAELVGDGPDWPDEVRTNRPVDPSGATMLQFEGTFATTMGLSGGKATFEISTEAEIRPAFDSVTVITLPEVPTFIRPGYPALVIVGNGPDDRVRTLMLVIDPIRAGSGKTLPADHHAVWALYTVGDAEDPMAPRVFFGIKGEVKLDAFEMKRGGRVEGSYTLNVPIRR